MWRKTAVLSVVALLLLLTSIVQAQDGFDSSTRAAVNLRGGPGTNYGVIQLLYAGEPIHIAGRSDDTGLWIYVSTPDAHTGWIYSLYTNAPSDQIARLPVLSIGVEIIRRQPALEA